MYLNSWMRKNRTGLLAGAEKSRWQQICQNLFCIRGAILMFNMDTMVLYGATHGVVFHKQWNNSHIM